MFCRPALQGPGVGFGWSAACVGGGFHIRPVRGGRERPPYGAGETRRPPGKMQFPRHTVGADSISARFAAARGLREGHAPPLHGIQARPAKWACRGRPGERRAGCPHPAGPRGGAGFRGRDKSRPYGQILCFRQTEQPRCLPRFAGEAHAPRRGPRQGRPGRYGIGPYMGCLRRWECSRF